jgi:gas vesicle protein
MNNTLSAAKDATEGAVKDVKVTIFDTLKSVAEAIAFVRRLHVDDALGVVGLARRPSAFANAGVFASGVLFGTGLGMLLAPTSGAEARAYLLGQFKASKDAVKSSAKSVESAVENAAGKIENKIESVATKAEKTISNEVKNGSDAIHHASSKIENRVKSSVEKSS